MRKWLIFPLLFSGCMVGPNFTPPCAPTQEKWLEEDEMLILKLPSLSWWEEFSDPVLDQIVTYAIQENKDLAQAAWRVEQARSILGIAVGQFFPQVQNAVGTAQNVGLSKHAPNTIPELDFHFWDYNLGFQAAWELDFWGKFRRGIESADASLIASYADWNDVWLLVVSQTASTYVQFRTVQEQIAIVLQNVKIQQRTLQITEAQFRGGFVTELDVQQALVLLRDTESRIPQLQVDLRRAETALAALLGMTPEDIGCWLTGEAKIPLPPRAASIGFPSELYYRRPDVKRTLYNAWAQSSRVGIATADFYPQISLTGFVGWESSGSIARTAKGSGGNLFSSDSLVHSWGPAFSWPLLNYGRITNRVRAERARLEELFYVYQNTVLQAYRETEDAVSLFLRSQDQTKLLEESVKAAERAVEIANKQYVEGLVDYTRVLITQQSLLQAQERLTLARGAICRD